MLEPRLPVRQNPAFPFCLSGRACLVLRQGCVSEIRLDNFHLRPDLFRLLGLNGRVYNHIVTYEDYQGGPLAV